MPHKEKKRNQLEGMQTRARARHSIIRLPVFLTLANRLSFSINIQIDWNRMHTIAIKWIHSYMQSIIMFPWVGVFFVLFFSALFGLVELAHAALKQTVKDVKQCRWGDSKTDTILVVTHLIDQIIQHELPYNNKCVWIAKVGNKQKKIHSSSISMSFSAKRK